MKNNPEPLIQSQPKETKKDSGIVEVVSEDMEIGDVDLNRMEAACSDKYLALIPLSKFLFWRKPLFKLKTQSP